jgi:hypothetical protein
MSAIQRIYFVYLLNINLLNPKHPRQTNDRSEIHLNLRDSIAESLNQYPFFVSLR